MWLFLMSASWGLLAFMIYRGIRENNSIKHYPGYDVVITYFTSNSKYPIISETYREKSFEYGSTIYEASESGAKYTAERVITNANEQGFLNVDSGVKIPISEVTEIKVDLKEWYQNGKNMKNLGERVYI